MNECMLQPMAPIYSAKSTPLGAQKLMKINFQLIFGCYEALEKSSL